VTCKRDSQTAYVSGPYENHHKALLAVDGARKLMNKLDHWTDFDAFGTCRLTPDPEKELPIGHLQKIGYNLDLEKIEEVKTEEKTENTPEKKSRARKAKTDGTLTIKKSRKAATT
jgi:hypothetical protein